jgi:predicted aconitase with swiveling domain
MDVVMTAHPLVEGTAEGSALVADEPLSFWGGYDSRTGEIIDRSHPLSGQCAAGRVLVLPYSRGSSTTTAVLLEALRAGTAPCAILVSGRDTFFALASIVADVLYGRGIPVIAIQGSQLAAIRNGDRVRVGPDGSIQVEHHGSLG